MRSELIRISVSENLKNKISVAADKEGRTVSNYIEFIIREYIKNPKGIKANCWDKSSKSVVAIRITPEFKAEISMYAAKENRTISNYIYLILQSEFGG